MLDISALVWYNGGIVTVTYDVRTNANWCDLIYRESISVNRFDLEDAIMNVWDIEQDIDTLLWKLMDCSEGSMTEDDLANYLLGMKSLLNLRCERLFDTYCKVYKLDHYREERIY